MNDFEKEMAIRRIVAADKQRLVIQRKDRALFSACALCLLLAAILPRGLHVVILYLAALAIWLVFVDALTLPRLWSEDSDLRWHVFRPYKIIENGFRKDKGWRTVILMVGLVVFPNLMRMR